MRILCSDPGVSGACVLFDGANYQLHRYPTYVVQRKTKKLGKTVITNRTHYDIPALVSLFRGLAPEVAVVEEVSSRPTDGAVASFSFGRGYGLILGILHTLGCEVCTVRPAIWKKSVGLPTGSTKNDSRLLALKLFPELSEQLQLKKNEAEAEALLILHNHLNPAPKKTPKRKTA